MRVLLNSRLHWPWSRWLAVVAWRGRQSGRRYSTPVSYVREGSIAWITTGDRWWRNLGDGAPVDMRIAGRWHSARGVPITDRAGSQNLHLRLFREHHWFRWLAGIPAGSDGEPETQAMGKALDAGRTLVRIDLAQ
jgi:hypothetical protein